MPGINATGIPNTKDYNLGRGKVFISELVNNLAPGYRAIGNVTEFNVSVELETLPHQSSQEGLKTVDLEVILSQALNLSMTFDETANYQNLALFLSGETSSYTNATTPTETTVAANTHLGPGYWYELVDQNGVRCYDIASVAFNVTDHGAAGTLGTDFLLDLAMGLIFIPTTTTLTNVAATDTLKYTVTMAASAPTAIDEVRALTQTPAAVALKFVSENPANADHKQEYEFHKVTLKSEGDLPLISDEITAATVTGAAEKNAIKSPLSPTVTIRTFSGGTNQ